jgi:hypothetical protein
VATTDAGAWASAEEPAAVRVRRPNLGAVVAGSAIVAMAIWLALWHPSDVWVELRYVNGFYLQLDAVVRAFTDRIPIPIGDVLLLAVLVAFVVSVVRAARAKRERRLRLLVVGASTLVSLAAIFIWFKIFWGLNYDRLPVAEKVPVRASAVDRAAVTALANHTASMLVTNAAEAHRELSSDDAVRDSLRPTFEAAIVRLGDRRPVSVPRVKPTVFDFMLGSTGDAGFMDPWTHEVNLYSGLLFFERPATFAHEWAHVAGFADESEANYIAVLSCINSKNALARYSGWLLVWFNLPSNIHVTTKVTRQVAADIQAIKERLARQVHPGIARAQQAAYGQYLKANRVAEGINSYHLFVRWMTGATYDKEGLPIVRPT